MHNPAIARAASRALKRPAETITHQDLAHIEVLPVIGTQNNPCDLHDLRDFEHLTAMTTLVMGFCQFEQLSALKTNANMFRMQMNYCGQDSLGALRGLEQLRELSCGKNGLTSLDGIETLKLDSISMERNNLGDLDGLLTQPQMTMVWANQNPLVDLSALDGLHKMEKLSLGHCAQEGFGSLFEDQLFYLQSMPALSTLELAHNNLQHLGWLEHVPGLTTLNVSGNIDIEDFSAIGDLTGLETLDLTVCTGLRDITFLERLPRLKTLSLKLCQHIQDFSPLGRLPSLQSLNLDAVPIPHAQIATDLIAKGVDVQYQESWIGAQVPPPDARWRLDGQEH